MSGRYAETTTVGVDRSRAELEKLLVKAGATGFSYGWQDLAGVQAAVVEFILDGRHVRLMLPLPTREEFTFTPTGKARLSASIDAAIAQGTRARWRALLLIVKAKLEAIAAGVVSFDEEWLPYLVLPDGRTVAATVAPGIAEAYATGATPQLLPGRRPELGS